MTQSLRLENIDSQAPSTDAMPVAIIARMGSQVRPSFSEAPIETVAGADREAGTTVKAKAALRLKCFRRVKLLICS
jgi:hypothetical protein